MGGFGRSGLAPLKDPFDFNRLSSHNHACVLLVRSSLVPAGHRRFKRARRNASVCADPLPLIDLLCQGLARQGRDCNVGLTPGLRRDCTCGV